MFEAENNEQKKNILIIIKMAKKPLTKIHPH